MNDDIQNDTAYAIHEAFLELYDVLDSLRNQLSAEDFQELKDDGQEYVTALISAVVACDGDLEPEELIFLSNALQIHSSLDKVPEIIESYVERWNISGSRVPFFIQRVFGCSDGQEHCYKILRMLQLIANNIANLDSEFEGCEIELIRNMIINIEAYMDGSASIELAAPREFRSLLQYDPDANQSIVSLEQVNLSTPNGQIEFLRAIVRRTFYDRGNYFISAKEVANNFRLAGIDPQNSICFLKQIWGEMVDEVCDGKLISQDDQNRLNEMIEAFALPIDELDTHGKLTKFLKACVINDLLIGAPKTRVTVDANLPLLPKKGEVVLWIFRDIELYKYVKMRNVVGGSTGVSIRLTKGLYWRVGGFKANPKTWEEVKHVETGLVVITNKCIYFFGADLNEIIPFTKLAAIKPYADALEIQRDAASARPQILYGIDGQFVYHVATCA
jgi:hypothetical protein